MRKTLLAVFLLLIVSFCGAAGAAEPDRTGWPGQLRFMAGPPGGNWFALGTALADMWTGAKLPQTTSSSGGGVANLQSYSLSILLPGTIMLLIVSGGIGFPVMVEIVDYQRGVRPFFSPYAKIVLTATSLLVVMGAVVITLSEWHNAFSALPYWARFWNALFGSVTSRTAGFDTVSISTWSTEGLIALGLFMLIGASPSSTGGGLKTTTFTVLLWSAWKELKQEDDVNIWGRQIASRTIRRALAMAFLYLFTLFFGSSLLSILEEQPFFSLVFEAVSALGTVGLSTGITSDLSSAGKMVIILLMYWGRVGLLTFSYSVVPQEKYAKVYLPETHIPIG